MTLAVALPVLAQAEPPLEPLVPPDAPWLQKNQKKRAKKKRAPKAPAQRAQTAPEPGLTLPPLEPLTLPPGAIGILVQPSVPAAARVESGLIAVAKRAPGVKDAFVLQAPQPCTEEACWITAGLARGAERVLVAGLEGGALRVRMLEVGSRKQVSEARQGDVGTEPAQVTAWAEALGCRLLVPAGCRGEAEVDAEKGVALEIDGQPLRAGEKRILPVGVHVLRIRDAAGESTRPLPILIEGGAPLLIAAPRPAAVAPVATAAPAPLAAPVAPVAAGPPAPLAAPAAAIAEIPPPASRRTWTRTAGYAAAGAAVVAVAAGAYFGAKSKSEIDGAESAYRANGNAWTSGDLDTLHSGNSKARVANALFIASGVLLATGAALTFAF
jgi:hypothetical protein